MHAVCFGCERFRNDFSKVLLCSVYIFSIYIYTCMWYFLNVFKTVFVRHAWGALECSPSLGLTPVCFCLCFFLLFQVDRYFWTRQLPASWVPVRRLLVSLALLFGLYCYSIEFHTEMLWVTGYFVFWRYIFNWCYFDVILIYTYISFYLYLYTLFI